MVVKSHRYSKHAKEDLKGVTHHEKVFRPWPSLRVIVCIGVNSYSNRIAPISDAPQDSVHEPVILHAISTSAIIVSDDLIKQVLRFNIYGRFFRVVKGK